MASKFLNGNINRIACSWCRCIILFDIKDFDSLISRLLTAFSMNCLQFSYSSLFFAIKFSFSTSVILDLLVTLSVRNGLTSFQNILLPAIYLVSILL